VGVSRGCARGWDRRRKGGGEAPLLFLIPIIPRYHELINSQFNSSHIARHISSIFLSRPSDLRSPKYGKR